MTQKCPQMFVFDPKIRHFKKTTLYSNSNRPFRQLILMDLPENLHSIDNLADRFKPYGKIFGIQVLRPEDFHQLSPDAKRYLGENIKNNVSNNSKTLPTTCGAIIEFETARTAKFCCGVLRKRVVEQGFRVAVLKPGAESELVAQGQALKRSFESKGSKSSSCVDSYSSRGESISSNSSGNEDVAKVQRSEAGNVQTSRNIPVQNYFIQTESVKNEIKHNIQHKLQDITTNNIHKNNQTPNQTKFQNSDNYHPTQTFNHSQNHNQNCNQIYPQKHVQNHNKISGQIHAQHNHTQQTSDAPYNTSYNSAYNQHQTYHQNPTYSAFKNVGPTTSILSFLKIFKIIFDKMPSGDGNFQNCLAGSFGLVLLSIYENFDFLAENYSENLEK